MEAQDVRPSGIAFTVDTATGRDYADGVLSLLRFKVWFAGGRGRIDVEARATRAPVRFKWVTFAQPTAIVGDYYLFDSTSFTHVRPASRSYVRYTLSGATFNYQMRREGWPFFRHDPETPSVAGWAARGTRGDYTVFWHTELTRDTSCTDMAFGHCLVRELARGREDVSDAPASELGVIRWFGATRALASITGLTSLTGAPIRVTAIGYWKRGDDDAAALPSIRFLLNFRPADVDPAKLALPKGYNRRRR